MAAALADAEQAPNEAGSSAPPSLNLEQKQQIRSRLKLDETIDDDKLGQENYDIHYLDAVLVDLKALAKACGVNTNASKIAVLGRILEWYAGSQQENRKK